MGFIVSRRKYEEALKEIKRLEEAEYSKEIDVMILNYKKYNLEKEIVSKDIEINRLNIENESLKNMIKTKNETLSVQSNAISALNCDVNRFEVIIESLEDRIEKLKDNYRDSEIEVLLAIKKKCKKARVKTKYKNKILKIAEKRLAEAER